MEDVPEVPYKQDAPTTDILGENCVSSLSCTAKRSYSNVNSQSDCSNFPQKFGLTANSEQTSTALVGAHVDPTVVHFFRAARNIFSMEVVTALRTSLARPSESAQPTTRVAYQQEVLATYLSRLLAKMTMNTCYS